MKRTKKVLMFVLALATVACTSLALASCGTPVEPPVAEAKVYSVTLQYDSANINGVLATDLSVGTVQLTAAVVKDAGATATVVYTGSDSSIAEVDETGLVTLKKEGEVVITATIGDLKHEIVLVIVDSSATTGYTITVNGGTADLTEAAAGETIVLTPVLPEDKEFSGWSWDDAIAKVSGNIFEMPAENVVITANFVDKLADISVVEEPTNNVVAKGSSINKDGLKIVARATLSGEEWDVTKDCTFSTYQSGDTSITASYTLGAVTRTAEIAVREVSSYTVDPETVQASAENKWKMNAKPEVMDEAYDGYKTTGYIAGTGSNLKFGIENGTFCIGNFVANNEVTYYFWSDVAANARITIGVASCAYFSSTGGSTPDSVSEIALSSAYSIYLNGDADDKPTINPGAKAEGHVLETPSWAVCGMFNDAYLFDMAVEYGWNSITFVPAGRQCNVSYLKAEFTGKDLAVFAENIEMPLSASMQLETAPIDLDKELTLFKETGAVLLEGSGNFSIGSEGGVMAIKSARKGCKATYYFYSEGAGTANVKLQAASSAYYGGATPNAVRAIDFKTQYQITVNGSVTQALDSAKIEAYSQEEHSWSVCQRFVTIDLLQMEVKKGWNSIEFLTISDDVANLAKLTVEFAY